MNYQDKKVGFSLELPDEWEKQENVLPLTFVSNKGVIQIQIGAPLPDFSNPSKLIEFLKDPESNIIQDKTLGEEINTVVIENANRHEGCISTVRDNFHYTITYTNAHNPTIKKAIDQLLMTFKFPNSKKATETEEKMSQAGPMASVFSEFMRSHSPEEARKTLSDAGMPPSIERQGYTIHQMRSGTKLKEGKERQRSAGHGCFVFILLFLLLIFALFFVKVY